MRRLTFATSTVQIYCISAMHQAEKSLYETLEKIYEPEWVGRDQLGGIKEVRVVFIYLFIYQDLNQL